MKKIRCKTCKTEFDESDAKGKRMTCGSKLVCDCGNMSWDWWPNNQSLILGNYEVVE